MFLDASDKLYVSLWIFFCTGWTYGNNTFYVQSDKSNLKQTLEIELQQDMYKF
jgi:hypothetical protein